MEKKYEFTGEILEYNGVVLNRIRSLKDFGNVKVGDIGGWVEKELNLSHQGNCWIYDEAKVYCNAIVFGNGKLFDSSEVYDSGWVFGNSILKDNSKVCGSSNISGNSWLKENAFVCGDSQISDAKISFNICSRNVKARFLFCDVSYAGNKDNNDYFQIGFDLVCSKDLENRFLSNCFYKHFYQSNIEFIQKSISEICKESNVKFKNHNLIYDVFYFIKSKFRRIYEN